MDSASVREVEASSLSEMGQCLEAEMRGGEKVEGEGGSEAGLVVLLWRL